MKNTICMHIVRRNVFSVLVMICVGERYTFIAMVFIRNLFQFICELQDSKRILHLCRHWDYVQDLMRHRGRWFFVRYDEFFANYSLIIITKLRIFKNSCWSMSIDWYSDGRINCRGTGKTVSVPNLWQSPEQFIFWWDSSTLKYIITYLELNSLIGF